jgi:hypothetical protein
MIDGELENQRRAPILLIEDALEVGQEVSLALER